MLERVTLRDIAKAAGVHYSTVSMALRDHPRISEEVTAQIKGLAEKMGYAPDAALSALNAYRKTKLQAHYQSTLAWIDNWPNDIRLRDQPTFNEYFLGAAARARQLGYELEEFQIQKEAISPDRLSRILQSRGIKGLLLAPQPSAGMQLPLTFDWFSTITFGYSLKPRIFHLVTNHQFHSMILAMEELYKLGYRRMGLFVHEDIDHKADNAYQTGYWNFCHLHPDITHLEPGLVRPGQHDVPLFRKWFRKEKPDVVISIGGLPVVSWLRDLDVSVPQEAGYARLSLAQDESYLSGIYENGFVIGSTAVDFLVGMLQRGEQGPPETPIRILVEGIWKSGQTVCPQDKPARSPAKKRRLAKSTV